jgi:hypothetical protein
MGAFVAVLILLVLALTIGLAVCLCRRIAGPACQRCWLRRLWAALNPDFTRFDTERDTTQTFHMLVAAMFIFAVILLLWAAGAAAMRTAWLFADGPDGTAKVPKITTMDVVSSPLAWLLLLLQVARAMGGVLLLCLAAGLVGALLGFLFGIPRPLSGTDTPPITTGGTAPPATTNIPQVAKAWGLSTNLTQISDWLTKIIVGVGLVEAKTAWGDFQLLTAAAAGWLFEMRHGSPAVIPAALIGGAVFGFLFTYLYTELIVARLIAAADAGLSTLPSPAATRPLQAIHTIRQALVPRISRSRGATETTDQPTQQEVNAALQYHLVRLADLTTRLDVQNWSRAKAILDDYRPAVDGYVRLLGMVVGPAEQADPGLLIEAARVLNAAEDWNGAQALAELALQHVAVATPEVQEAIIGDAVALRLAGRVPGGYQAALDLLSTPNAAAVIAQSARLRLLRALANGQRYEATAAAMATDQERTALRTAVLDDLRFAFQADATMRQANRGFLDGTAPDGAHDLVSFRGDQEFRTLFGL